MRKKSGLFLGALAVILVSFCTPVSAITNKLTITDASVISKSSTTTAESLSYTDNTFSNNITFTKQNDYIELGLTLKNTSSEEWAISSIKDNLTSENLNAEYAYSTETMAPGDNADITIKLIYINQVKNVEKISLNDLEITLNLRRTDGSEEEDKINPKTGDNIFAYIATSVVAIAGLICVIITTKNKKVKVAAIIIVAIAAIVLPVTVLANEGGEAKIYFTNIDLVGEFETYDITIDPNNGDAPITKQVQYGQKIGELPNDPSKDGYYFDNWQDNNGNTITSDTVITEPIGVSAKYTPITYQITYDLAGGTIDGNNKTQYTIETESFDLINPALQGYNFSGWSKGTSEELQTRVTVPKGTYGDLSFTAHYSADPNTNYTVTHKYEPLEGGEWETEIEHLQGTTGTRPTPAFIEKTGFKNPDSAQIEITPDGEANLDYVYLREEYAFNIPDRTYIDNSSTPDGNYKYGTEITVKAIERNGYTFDHWSDNSTDITHTFAITNTTSIEPVYTANTNTSYTVKHETMNTDGETYTEVPNSQQNLTGTTDDWAEPSPNEYAGFYTPETQRVAISGNGDTVITYRYKRKKYTVTLEDAEHIETTATSGEQYFYESQITLTAKDKAGHTFAGWTNGQNDQTITITIGADDITIGPVYNVNSYTVTFNPNGGTIAESDATKTVEYNAEIGSLPTPTYDDHGFLGWFTEAEGGDQISSETKITSTIEYYAHWGDASVTLLQAYERAGKEKVTVGGQEYYKMQDMKKDSICDTATVINDTLQVADIRDNHIYTIGKLADNKCWLLDNLALDFTDEAVRNNITPDNTNTVKPGIDYLQYYSNTTNYPAIAGILTERNDEARTSGSPMLEGEETWKYGNLYNVCAASGGTTCYERYNQGIEDEPFDICPSGWRLPTGGANGEYNDLAEAVIGKRGTISDENEISAYRAALHMPFAGQVRMNNRYIDDQTFYWAKTINSESYSYIVSASRGSYPKLHPNSTSSNEYLSSVRCIADDEVYRISFEANGGDININQFGKRLEPGSSIGELPEPTRQGYTFDGWYNEINGGEKISSSTIPSDDTTYYAHWINQSKTLEDALSEAGKEKISIDGDEYYKLQDINKAICDATTNVEETLDTIDIRDNTIYKVGKRKDGNCWLLDNLRLDISDASVRANMTPENTNTTQAGIDKLAEVQANTTQTEGITTPHIYTTNKDNSRTTGEHLLDGESEWKYGISYNACALFGGEFCERTSQSKPYSGTVQTDICPSNWIVPNVNNYTNLMSSYSIHGSGSRRSYIDDVTRIRSALRLPVNPATDKHYWTSRYFQDQHGFTYEFYALKAGIGQIITGDTYSFISVARNLGDAPARCMVDARATITFDANGGELDSDKTTKMVDFDGKIGEMPTPSYTNMRFLGWFTEADGGEEVTEESVFKNNTTIYAHWSSDIFPIVWQHENECTFSNGNISGDDCQEYAGQSYIDTGISLYDDTNYKKDYEIYFEISEYGQQNVKQATMMNEKYENSSLKWPGIVVRRENESNDNIEITETISNTKASKSMKHSSVTFVRIIRKDGVVYYQTDGTKLTELQDLNDLQEQKFGNTTWFGAAEDENGDPFRFFNGSLKNMYIRLGRNNNADVVSITYNPNGGTLSKTKAHVERGTAIGSLPTPTRENHYFDGWYTALENGEKINKNTIVNNDTTYYAIWGRSIEGATINPENTVLEKGSEQTVSITNIDESYTFKSNDTNVAIVNSNGKISAISVGETTITITGSKSRKTRTISVQVIDPVRTITYNAYGGNFSDGQTSKTVTYKVYQETVTKYSYTSNIDETGKSSKNYGSYWTNANIRGTDRGDTSKAHVVTIPNSKQITVEIYYNSRSSYNDYVSIWEGSHPDYTAASNYSSAISGAQKLGGSQTGTYTVNNNTLNNVGYKKIIINGDTVTFGFKSGNSYANYNYGYYAIISGVSGTAEVADGETELSEEPTNAAEGGVFDGWCTTQACGENDNFIVGLAESDMEVYAKWQYTISFDTKGGSAVDDRVITKNHSVGALPTSTKDEFEIEGWYTDDNYVTKIDANTVPSSSTTYTANWNDLCNNFRDDSWSTVVDNITDNPDYYRVGCKKDIDYDTNKDGTTEKVKLRISNTSTPAVCNDSSFSQTACGFVLEFIGGLDTVAMGNYGNSTIIGNMNNGGWEYSNGRRYTNSTVLDRLPSDLRDITVDTTVVSGHGSYDTENFITTDRVYIPSSSEVYNNSSYDTAANSTRRLDYYPNKSSEQTTALKYFVKEGSQYKGVRAEWWLRTATGQSSYSFVSACLGNLSSMNATTAGQTGYNQGSACGNYADINGIISPAFRIGSYYTITYDAGENASFPSIYKNTKRNKVGEKVGAMPKPTKSGYYFDEWVTTPNNHGTAVDADYIPNNNITLYATWKKSIENATISPDNISLHKGEEATITLTDVDEGYEFVSNNPNVASVDENGKIQWVSTGTTTITITGKQSKQTRNVNVEMIAEITNHTITYDANGGTYSNTSDTKDIHYTKSGAIQKKISYSMNIDSTGKKLSNVGDNWDEYNIRGTDRGSLSSSHVITIPGAQALNIEIYYSSQSTNSVFATIWKGSHPSYKASDYYARQLAIPGAATLGGKFSETYDINGNTVTNIKRSDFRVDGDTVTIGFRGSGPDSYYGYYAIITGDATNLETTDTYEVPTNGDAIFNGWYTDANCTAGNEFNPSLMEGDMTVYAKWLNATVTFDPTGGNLAQAEQSRRVSTNHAIGTLPVPTSSEYVFDGWWTQATGGERITESTIFTDSATVYAHWKDPLSMQQVSTWKDDITVGEEVVVRDERDMKMYRAKKLKQGDNEFIWMLDDLALDATDNNDQARILTSEDSDITPNDTYSTFTMPTEAWTSSSQNYYCKAIMAKSNGVYYYNYSTAFASQYVCASPTQNTSSEVSKVKSASLGTICPKGWTLPSNTYSSAIWDNAANTGELKFNGDYRSGSARSVGESGNYWARSGENNNYITFWYYTSSGITPNNYSGILRDTGSTIRCIAE